jgi:hypothetical protein
VCQAVRAHGVNVTSAELKVRAEFGLNNGLTLTLPVKWSADPSAAGLDSSGEISMASSAGAASVMSPAFLLLGWLPQLFDCDGYPQRAV